MVSARPREAVHGQGEREGGREGAATKWRLGGGGGQEWRRGRTQNGDGERPEGPLEAGMGGLGEGVSRAGAGPGAGGGGGRSRE